MMEFACEVEGAGPYPPAEMVAGLQAVLRRFGALADWTVPTERRDDLRRFRHSLPESVNEFARAHQGKLGTDLAVPREHFRLMYEAHEAIAGQAKVDFLIFGHIGDAHVHLNFLPRDAEEAARARRAYLQLARRAVELGGTVSAEHGVGKKTIELEPGRQVPYLRLMYGEKGLRAVAAVKRALDPTWILNQGNMIPPEAASFG